MAQAGQIPAGRSDAGGVRVCLGGAKPPDAGRRPPFQGGGFSQDFNNMEPLGKGAAQSAGFCYPVPDHHF